jgi:hypothetical protein
MPVRYVRRPRADPEPDAEAAPAKVPRRSNAAVYVALPVLVLGAALGTVTLLAPALLALLLFSSAIGFLGTRLNPLSPTFYLTTKPTWLSIGVLFGSAFLLGGIAYEEWLLHLGPLLPHLP